MTQEHAQDLSLAFAKFTHDEGMVWYGKPDNHWLYDGQMITDEDALRLFKEHYSKTGDIYEFFDRSQAKNLKVSGAIPE